MDSGMYITNDKNQNAFRHLRDEVGMLQVEVKLKSRDRNTQKFVYVEALEVVDQITSAMNQQERLKAYTDLSKKLNKS